VHSRAPNCFSLHHYRVKMIFCYIIITNGDDRGPTG
jgi:hypothetical protein